MIRKIPSHAVSQKEGKRSIVNKQHYANIIFVSKHHILNMENNNYLSEEDSHAYTSAYNSAEDLMVSQNERFSS